MSKNPYEQFFAKAQDVKRGDEPVDKIKFSLKTKTGKNPPLLKKAPSSSANEKLLREAVKMRPKKPPVPWKAIGGLIFSLVLAGAYVVSPATFENLLSKIEVRAVGQAEAADADTTKKSPDNPAEKSTTPTGKEEKAASSPTAGSKAKSPEGKSAVNEEFSQFEKLKQRKEELDAREKEVSELEEELQRQKVELDKRITQLDEMRNQIARTLKDRVDVDQEKVNKLVDLYSNMKPKQAADVIGSINEELAVEVLAKMKKKNAAEIMNLLSPEKARVLSEKYTGYRRISSQEPKG